MLIRQTTAASLNVTCSSKDYAKLGNLPCEFFAFLMCTDRLLDSVQGIDTNIISLEFRLRIRMTKRFTRIDYEPRVIAEVFVSL